MFILFFLMRFRLLLVLGITARDIRVIKPKGSIEATLRVRHFQVDAMLNSARYPIILQPLPLGVDRRQPLHDEKDEYNKIVTKKDCFWESHNELPIPLLEFSASYVPQTNMIWMPSCRLLIAPCKGELLICLNGLYSQQKYVYNINAF